MTTDPTPRPVAVTLVHSPACHFCDEAQEVLAELGGDFAFELSVVPLESAVGATLVAVHRPAMYPLVLVDGAFFSSGRLPRKKLTRFLEARRAELAGRRIAAGR